MGLREFVAATSVANACRRTRLRKSSYHTAPPNFQVGVILLGSGKTFADKRLESGQCCQSARTQPTRTPLSSGKKSELSPTKVGLREFVAATSVANAYRRTRLRKSSYHTAPPDFQVEVILLGSGKTFADKRQVSGQCCQSARTQPTRAPLSSGKKSELSPTQVGLRAFVAATSVANAYRRTRLRKSSYHTAPPDFQVEVILLGSGKTFADKRQVSGQCCQSARTQPTRAPLSAGKKSELSPTQVGLREFVAATSVANAYRRTRLRKSSYHTSPPDFQVEVILLGSGKTFADKRLESGQCCRRARTQPTRAL